MKNNDDLQRDMDALMWQARMLYADAMIATQSKEAPKAWSEFNHAHRHLAEIFGAKPSDRLFLRSDGRNPWGYPDGLGDRILWSLSSMSLHQVGWMGNGVLISTGESYGPALSYHYWLIGDNGGELSVFKINDPVSMQYPGIACTGGHFHGYYAQPMRWAMTIAGWIRDRILKGEVNYAEKFGDGDQSTFDLMEGMYTGRI